MQEVEARPARLVKFGIIPADFPSFAVYLNEQTLRIYQDLYVKWAEV